MKVAKFLSIVFFSFSSTIFSMAQDTQTVSDEELKKYAVAMDSIDVMKSELIKTMNDLIKNNPKITAARYNELSKIINDEQKLTEAKATPDEITAVKEVLAKKNEGTLKINETVQSLAKDFVGAATYNKVKKALGADPEVKSRYEAILAEVKKS